MRIVILATIVCFVLVRPGHAQQDLPPCGPAAQLSEEFSENVAADSRCFEVRMYTADTARDGVGDYERTIDELHQRFREGRSRSSKSTVPISSRCGRVSRTPIH